MVAIEEIAARDPEIAEILSEAGMLAGRADWTDYERLKKRAARVVGWDRDDEDELLGSERCYELVMRALADKLGR